MAVAWGVGARVIYPPVDVTQIQRVPDWRTELTATEAELLDAMPDSYVLGASRFVRYKRLDLVIKAGEAAGRPVVLAGRGPELSSLQAAAAAASVPVTFVDRPSTALLYALYQQCGLFVFPAIEDFGIMPVEAMATGAPVLAQAVGGTSESVVPGVTGALCTFDSAAEIRDGVSLALTTTKEQRLVRAQDFSAERFRRELQDWVGVS